MFALHRGRRPAVGRAAAPLGRARQPRPHRGASRVAAAHDARARPAPRAACARRSRRWTRAGSRVARATRTCIPRSRTGSPAGCRASASGCTPAARATTRSPATSGSSSRTGCSRCTRAALELADALLALRRPAPHGALAGLHPPAAGHAVVGRALGRGATPRAARYRRVAAPRSGRRSTARRSAARPATACRCRSSARPRRARSASRGSTATSPTVQGGRGKLEAAALFWCTQLGHELARLVAGRDPVQRRGVRLPGAAGRAGDRVEHHAAQAEPRSVRADPRRARRRSRATWSPCCRSRASSPAATSATSSC